MFRDKTPGGLRAAILLLSLILIPDLSFSQGLEKRLERVRVGLPSFSISFVFLPVAPIKGFFARRGWT